MLAKYALLFHISSIQSACYFSLLVKHLEKILHLFYLYYYILQDKFTFDSVNYLTLFSGATPITIAIIMYWLTFYEALLYMKY